MTAETNRTRTVRESIDMFAGTIHEPKPHVREEILMRAAEHESEQEPPLTVVVHNHAGSKPDNDPVNHPSHYTAYKGLEVIQLTEQMNFNLGNSVKYICRADFKGNAIQDLEKARWYINREIERRKGEAEDADAPF